jgi:hypothetical protein
MERRQSIGRRHKAVHRGTLAVLSVVLASSCSSTRADSLPTNCVKTSFDLGRPTKSKPSSFRTTGGDIYITVTDSQNDEGIEFPVGNHFGGGPLFKIYPEGASPTDYDRLILEYVKPSEIRHVKLRPGRWLILSTGLAQALACAPVSIDEVQVRRR